MNAPHIRLVEEKMLRSDVPDFRVGDRVEVHQRMLEGPKERIQVFEGDVIARHNGGVRETFTVRRLVQGEGVERIFPVHSPRIAKIVVKKAGAVRRAKLYYLRDKVGKSARVAERRWGIEDEVLVAEEEAEAVDAEGVAVGEAEAELVEPPEEEGEASEGGDQAAKEQPPAEDAESEASRETPEAEDAGDQAEANQEPEPEATADAAPEKAED